MAEVTIALPFSIDSYGKVASTTDQSKIWTDRVRSVIGTSLRERVMRPFFGTIIPFSLFETATTATAEIKTEVAKAFNQQLRLLKLDSVTTSFDEYTGAINVEITYALPNNEMTKTVIGLVLIDRTNPLYQEPM